MSVETFSEPEAKVTAEQMRIAVLGAKLAAVELRSDITVLSGSGANIVVLDDPDGKLLVDSGFEVSKPELEASLAAISSRQMKYLVNTHFHFDHTEGNEWLHEAGATIVAHAHTRMRLSITQRIPAFRFVRSASPLRELPTITFHQQIQLELRNESVLLKRYSPAHTDSDIAVYFERHDVLHTGDTWFNDIYPFIDYEGGGSFDGLIAATRDNLALSGPRTLVVPGHGAVGSRDDLLDFYDMLLETRGEVARLKASGLPIEEVLDLRPASRFEAKYGSGFVPYDLFVYQVYAGIE